MSKAAGCSGELNEGVTERNNKLLNLYEILGQLSTNDLLEELNRRKHLIPTNASAAPKAENTGNTGTRERYGLELECEKDNKREEATLATKPSTSLTEKTLKPSWKLILNEKKIKCYQQSQ